MQRRITTLNTEVGQLAGLQQVNAQLREQLNTPVGLSQQEQAALAEAKARAQRIQCINNLKQVGLGLRLYSGDNNDVSPPDFLTMSNELSTPKILFCPGNTNQPAVKTWAEFAATSSSYEYFTAGATDAEDEPQRIATYCRLHNIFGLCDGSVQDLSKRRYEDCVVERDGKLYLEIKGSTR